MATSIGATVLYKTNSGYVPAIITAAFSDAVGTRVDNVASTDSSVLRADLLVLGLTPVRLANVLKDQTLGTDGAVAAGTNASTTVADVVTGTWFTVS